MQLNKENSEKMDLVLNYLLANPNARVKSKQVQEILQISFEDARNIYELILNYHQQIEPLISILNADNIAARPNITEAFIQKGGFKLVYKLQSKKNENKTVETFDKPNEQRTDWQSKTYWITFTLAVLGFIMGSVSLLFSFGIFK